MADYRVSASLEDFVLKRQSGYDFIAQRIAGLEISVVDKNGDPLSDVHVSLTAYETRLSQVTNAAGIAKFANLNPQTYYVTAILKEFQFDQNVGSFTVREGEQSKEVLVGRRIAFSAYG